jgi:hypothetical protein
MSDICDRSVMLHTHSCCCDFSCCSVLPVAGSSVLPVVGSGGSLIPAFLRTGVVTSLVGLSDLASESGGRLPETYRKQMSTKQTHLGPRTISIVDRRTRAISIVD